MISRCSLFYVRQRGTGKVSKCLISRDWTAFCPAPRVVFKLPDKNSRISNSCRVQNWCDFAASIRVPLVYYFQAIQYKDANHRDMLSRAEQSSAVHRSQFRQLQHSGACTRPFIFRRRQCLRFKMEVYF
ncbi:hypothetical protein VNO80_08698 [Phaseolus coccineus]|uniref:Uncharacterized protein n=1 Tax=Phaseolus coccineus TaxID=3886 RepID=A0AAN9N6Q4_PHACN